MEVYFKFDKKLQDWSLKYLLQERNFLVPFSSFRRKYLEDLQIDIQEKTDFIRICINSFTRKYNLITIFNETVASYLFGKENISIESSIIFPHHRKVSELIGVIENFPSFEKGLFYIEQNGEIVITSTDLTIIFSIIESFLESVCY